jgi:hypothetical protein
MSFGVSIKLAPGMRVRASSRGIRASVGPRVARVHMGAGRTILSTGIGPFTSSTSVDGRRKPASGGRGGVGAGTPRTTLAALERQTRQAQREAEIAAVARTERALVSLHHEEFRPAQRPVLPLPPPVDPGLIEQAMLARHLAGVSPLQRARRRQIKELAVGAARAEAARQNQAHLAGHAQEQARLDGFWNALTGHLPEAVIAQLELAFEDNQSSAACMDVGEDPIRYATVLVMFGPPQMIPDQKPAWTPGGQPTLRKRTKTDRNALYTAALGSTVLATVKESFAVAPSVEEIRVLVISKNPQALTPETYLSAIYAARFRREPLQRWNWPLVDPVEALLTAPDAMLKRKGATQETTPLDLSSDPDLATLMERLRADLR